MGYGCIASACFFLLFPIFIGINHVDSMSIFAVLAYVLMFMGFYQAQRRLHNRWIQVGWGVSFLALITHFIAGQDQAQGALMLCEIIMIICMMMGVWKSVGDILQKKIKQCLWLYGFTWFLLFLVMRKPSLLHAMGLIIVIFRLLICLKIVSCCRQINHELAEVKINQYHQKQIPKTSANTILAIVLVGVSLAAAYGSQSLLQQAAAKQNQGMYPSMLYQSAKEQGNFVLMQGQEYKRNEQTYVYDIYDVTLFLTEDAIGSAAHEMQIYQDGNALLKDKEITMQKQGAWWYLHKDNMFSYKQTQEEQIEHVYQIVLYGEHDVQLFDQSFIVKPVPSTYYQGNQAGITIQDIRLQGVNVMNMGRLSIAMGKMPQYDDVTQIQAQLVFYAQQQEVARSQPQLLNLRGFQNVYKERWYQMEEEENIDLAAHLGIAYDHVDVLLTFIDDQGKQWDMQMPLEQTS